jgi:hypothetical protein
MSATLSFSTLGIIAAAIGVLSENSIRLGFAS